jgi:hypothetical protein
MKLRCIVFIHVGASYCSGASLIIVNAIKSKPVKKLLTLNSVVYHE